MNDTPGWASPGSTPSDGQQPGAPGPSEPADRPAAQPDNGPQDSGSKWSQQQPPPGQWSAPTNAPGPNRTPPPVGPGWGGRPPAGPPGGYGGGPGGPGGYGAWGGGWGGPPPAAKPGVIPLRPLGVGELLDGAVSTMRTYWRTVLGISLTVAVITEVASVLFQGFVLNDAAGTDALSRPGAPVDDVMRALGEVMLGSVIVGLITTIGTIIATALLTTVTSRAVLGRPVTTGEAWREARPQVLRLIGLVLLLLLIAVGVLFCGALPGIIAAVAGADDVVIALLLVLGLLAGTVVAVWLMIRFSLASPALMLEKQSILKSMSRSTKLVRGSWWRVFGIQLLASIIASIIGSIVVIPFTLIAAALSGDGFTMMTGANSGFGWSFLIITGIGSVIGSMITLPITAGVTVLLYVDQRIRREALDLELARAAGLQGYGTGATPGS